MLRPLLAVLLVATHTLADNATPLEPTAEGLQQGQDLADPRNH